MRTMALRTRFAVIVYGYLVVIAIFAAFLALQEMPQDLYGIQLERLNVTERFVVSVIVVAPVILGLLWDRLKGLKIGEIEVVLEQASPTINIELASAIQKSQGSQTIDLVNVIASAIAQADLKLVEVNLRCRPYWWTTRLFLLAALTQEYTNVQRLVFVKHDALRLFVGIATPASVRRVLGERFPPLETAFTTLFGNAGPHTAETKQQEVQTIGFGWPSQLFLRDGAFIQEIEFREKISVRTLCEWLGPELQTETRQWSGGPPGTRLYAKILASESPFVPLLIGPRLAKVVDRGQLVERLAIAAVM
jgi:hypothetical protein